MLKILFIFDEAIHGSTLREKPLGGISTSMIMLAEAFARMGHIVSIYNENNNGSHYNDVYYRSDKISQAEHFDIAIANNSANYLLNINTSSPIVWQHNRTSLSKAWKRREYIALIKLRPALVTLSEDALNNTPWLLPYRTKVIIPHAIEDFFLTPNDNKRQEKSVYFASRASRNLSWLIDLWMKRVHPAEPDAVFYVCTPPGSTFSYDIESLNRFNIRYLGSLKKQHLAEMMSRCSALIYPGHKNETGCQVALQAIGMCTPIITCGHGSLKNLVEHNVNGFLEDDDAKFASRIIELLNSPELFKSLSQGAYSSSFRKSYDSRAREWLDFFGSLSTPNTAL